MNIKIEEVGERVTVDVLEQAEEAAGRAAQAALRRIDKDRLFEDWLKVGEGLVAAEQYARRAARIRPGDNRKRGDLGPSYKKAMSKFLKQYQLDEAHLKQPQRWALQQIMDNLAAVVAWRSALPQWKRQDWNSPKSVWSHYGAHLRAQLTESKPARSDRAEQNQILKQHIAQLAITTAHGRDEPEHMAGLLDEQLRIGARKLESVYRAWRPLAELRDKHGKTIDDEGRPEIKLDDGSPITLPGDKDDEEN
jgi:hypothetical protein